MAKPQSRAELLNAIDQEAAALQTLLDGLAPAEWDVPLMAAWTAKDTVYHLVAWMEMVLAWMAAGERDETPELPAPGFKWSQLPALNEKIRQQGADLPRDAVRARFAAALTAVRAATAAAPEEALFRRGAYAWAGNNALASYLNSCSGAHFRWARTELRKGLKARAA
jgi:hypothetical protein